MLKAYKYRLYPTEEQKEFFEMQFGSCRFVYNWALEQKIHMYNKVGCNLSIYTLQKSLSHVQKVEHTWLKDSISISLVFSLRNLETAYKKFFKEGAGFPNLNQSVILLNHSSFIKDTLLILIMEQLRCQR